VSSFKGDADRKINVYNSLWAITSLKTLVSIIQFVVNNYKIFM
jgi:hypothetical protein